MQILGPFLRNAIYHKSLSFKYQRQVISALLLIVSLFTIGHAIFYWPFTLNQLVVDFNNITTLEVAEWTGSLDLQYTFFADDAQPYLEYLGNIKLRRVMQIPEEFPLRVRECYRISGRNIRRRILVECALYQGYLVLNGEECYEVISPESFYLLHHMMEGSTP